ncbi:hypothetical protein [uncultured Aquimarina sp.]|uniref:hypothetical protein n=1 Tax=uncultured Aquimarina sp. TaxID=575652 RepID=UPI0026233753|nr:hypothetical protein [uncultured Aquimarina sp.]
MKNILFQIILVSLLFTSCATTKMTHKLQVPSVDGKKIHLVLQIKMLINDTNNKTSKSNNSIDPKTYTRTLLNSYLRKIIATKKESNIITNSKINPKIIDEVNKSIPELNKYLKDYKTQIISIKTNLINK